MPGREQAGRVRGYLGRVQPLLPQLLHESLGEAEQQVPSVSTGVECSQDRNLNNNNHIFGRNGTYVQNIYIKFIFTALSYQAPAEQFNSKSYSDKIQTIDKIYTQNI